MKSILQRALVIALCALCMSATAAAQSPADVAPGDTLLYVGWCGRNHMPEGFDESLWAQYNRALQPANFRSLISQVAAANATPDEEAFAQMQEVMAVWDELTANPGAWIVRDVSFAGGDVKPAIAIIMDTTGADGNVEDTLRRLNNPETGDDVKVHRFKNLIMVDINDALMTGAAMKFGDDYQSLAKSTTYQETIRQLSPNPAMVVYANGQKLNFLVTRIMMYNASDAPMGPMIWSQLQIFFGLNAMKSLGWSAGLNGQLFEMRAHAAWPAGNRALMSALPHEPVGEAELALVPGSAATVFAMRIDPADAFNRMKTAVNNINPQFTRHIDTALAQARQQTGIDLEADLFAALGPSWVMYSDRHVAGAGVSASVIVNTLRDAPRAARTLSNLEQIINAVVEQQMPKEEHGPQLTIAFRTTVYEGLEVHYLGTPLLSPSWVIDGDRLYVGMTPQVVAGAVLHDRNDAEAIGSQVAFDRARRQLDVPNAAALSYFDLEQTAPDTYVMYMYLSRLSAGVMDMLGADANPFTVPPLPRIMPLLRPSMAAMWSDEDGLHWRSQSPYPGASLLATGGSGPMVVNVPLMAGILLPALGAARRTARQMQSSTQLRGLHMAAILYARGNDGKMTNDLGLLYKDGYFIAEYVLAPTSDKKLPPGFEQSPEDERMQWIRENASYMLMPDLKADNDPNRLAGFTKLPDAGTSGVSIVWNDNHVTFVRMDEARQTIKEKTGKSLEAWSGLE